MSWALFLSQFQTASWNWKATSIVWFCAICNTTMAVIQKILYLLCTFVNVYIIVASHIQRDITHTGHKLNVNNKTDSSYYYCYCYY